MKNQSTKLATELFHIAQPAVEKLVTDVLVKHATSRDTVLAITYLMEQIKVYRSGCPKMKVRKFSNRWIQVLRNMAMNGACYTFVHRKSFLQLGSNDFSLMKYWGLIQGDGKGKWKITPDGVAFLYSGTRIPDRMIQKGIKDGRYGNCSDAKFLSIGEF